MIDSPHGLDESTRLHRAVARYRVVINRRVPIAGLTEVATGLCHDKAVALGRLKVPASRRKSRTWRVRCAAASLFVNWSTVRRWRASLGMDLIFAPSG